MGPAHTRTHTCTPPPLLASLSLCLLSPPSPMLAAATSSRVGGLSGQYVSLGLVTAVHTYAGTVLRAALGNSGESESVSERVRPRAGARVPVCQCVRVSVWERKGQEKP